MTAVIRVAEERRKAFEARIVDDVKPGEQQSEADHAFKGERSSSGGSAPRWRDAREERRAALVRERNSR